RPGSRSSARSSRCCAPRSASPASRLPSGCKEGRMAREARAGLGFADRLVLLVAWIATCGLVYLLGFYVGQGTQEHRLGGGGQVGGAAVQRAPPPGGRGPKGGNGVGVHRNAKNGPPGGGGPPPPPGGGPAAGCPPPAGPCCRPRGEARRRRRARDSAGRG